MLDSGAEGPGFKSQLRRCRVTVLGKMFTPIVPLFTKQQKLVAALLRIAEVTASLAESNGSLPLGLWLTSPAGWLPRTEISSNPMLGNRVWATFTFLDADAAACQHCRPGYSAPTDTLVCGRLGTASLKTQSGCRASTVILSSVGRFL